MMDNRRNVGQETLLSSVRCSFRHHGDSSEAANSEPLTMTDPVRWHAKQTRDLCASGATAAAKHSQQIIGHVGRTCQMAAGFRLQSNASGWQTYQNVGNEPLLHEHLHKPTAKSNHLHTT